ncbi:hypothetical protein DFH09DRAFT_1094697 [Mycena vulgaris]|nr:hypothetical protein DFH09DRAFT_1094697 [Mycena vulgaris]
MRRSASVTTACSLIISQHGIWVVGMVQYPEVCELATTFRGADPPTHVGTFVPWRARSTPNAIVTFESEMSYRRLERTAATDIHQIYMRTIYVPRVEEWDAFGPTALACMVGAHMRFFSGSGKVVPTPRIWRPFIPPYFNEKIEGL